MFISKKIEYFMQTAETLSFKSAADKLYLSITPVCKGVHDLEFYLGYKLFFKESSNLALTKEGVLLYQALAPVIEHLKKIENESKKIKSESISIEVDGFYFYGINEIIKIICQEKKLPVHFNNSNKSDLKTYFLNNSNSIMIVNSLNQEERIYGEKFIDLGPDKLKIAISTEVFEKKSDIIKLMHEIPLVQLSTTLKHPYYSIIHKYRETNNINTNIFSMAEVPGVSTLITEGIAMSFVSGTVESGKHWRNGKVMLVEPPIKDLAVYRKIYYKSGMFKNGSKFMELMRTYAAENA